MPHILGAPSVRPTPAAAGHLLRLRRILGADGRTTVLPLDHAITFGPRGGLESASSVIDVARRAGFHAVMLRPGLVPAVLDTDTRDLGMILCVTGRLDRGVDHVLLNSVEQAAASGADAVCAEFKLGSDGELANAQVVSTVAEEAHRMGLPLLVTVYALPDILDRNGTDAHVHACRIAEELGADLVKSGLPDDEEVVRRCVAATTVPLIVAGGTADGPDALVGRVGRAVAAGAAGAAVGRGIWGSPDPYGTALRVRRAVAGDAPAAAPGPRA
ncbi:class I fructose-bisphosphate aldolase [Streptomyces sp. NPDC057249]|uniref:class I fructose-bisphosphate aldolase n=1 Tax=Streptomyces sp. NPDC057249 TaxID=3346067 RepID=UPI003636B7BF